MTVESDEDRIDRLIDALVDDVLRRSDDKLLDEAAEAYGDRQALATQFDNLLNPILKQSSVKKSNEWMSFDLLSRPLASYPATEAVSLNEPVPLRTRAAPPVHLSFSGSPLKFQHRTEPSTRSRGKRRIVLAAAFIAIVGLPSSYYILKRQIEKGANTEITQKIQEVEQQKREIQQRLALLISEVELRRKTEEDRSTQQASRATINASPSAISSPSTIAPSSLTIRAPVQLRVGDNFIQIFFFAQHAIDVQHALRRIQSQFPKQAKNATVILQADVAARDAFYGIQIGAFETPARAEQACTTLRGPAVQCFVQLSRSVMPPTSLGDAVSVRPPATTPSSPAAAAGVTPCSPDDRKFMPEKGWVSNCR